jgi:hypothetical protein
MIATHRQQLEDSLRQLAPADLADKPLFCVGFSELPKALRPAGCGGYTAPGFDVVAKDVIGPRWREGGAAIAVDDTGASVPPTFDSLFAVGIHELAHVLVDFDGWLRQPAPQVPPTKEWFALSLTFAVQHAVRDPARYAETHGPAFTRVALHLIARARRLRHEVWAPLTVDGGLRFLRCCRNVLRQELRRLRDAPLRDIIATPPPPAYQALWARVT